MNFSEGDGLPKSLSEAKEKGTTHYFTGRPCKYGHIAKRYTSNRLCCECNLKHGESYYWDNHDKELLRRKKWRENNPDYLKNWRRDNPEYMSNYCKEWRNDNPDYPKFYYQKNKAIIMDRVSERRSQKLQRCIEGYEEEISKIYKECVEKSNATGIPHHVDHIVPLNGETVSGLHVPWNLQILTAEENLKKSNKFENSLM